MKRMYDCTYYWVGGTDRGRWQRADPGLKEAIERQGYYAVDGNSNIGPPEGSPLSWIPQDDPRRAHAEGSFLMHPDGTATYLGVD